MTAGTSAGQCLQLGLLDAVAVDLVPVVMGEAVPFLGGLSVEDVAVRRSDGLMQGDRGTTCCSR